jgi:hypothetical protein
MDFTIAPRSPKNTVLLLAALAAALLWSLGSSSKPKAKPKGAELAASASAVPGRGPGAVSDGFDRGALPDGGLPLATPSASGDSHFAESPFLDLVDLEIEGPGEAADAEADEPTLVLQGTATSAGRSLALISGKYYTPGQDVDGWSLAWISPREVRLLRDGETLTLRMERE